MFKIWNEIKGSNVSKNFSAAKEQKKSTKTAKKATQPVKQKPVQKAKAAKNVQKQAPRVGGKR